MKKEGGKPYSSPVLVSFESATLVVGVLPGLGGSELLEVPLGRGSLGVSPSEGLLLLWPLEGRERKK